jgi:hypothetical protein
MIDGAKTVSVVVGASPPGAAVAVMVYVPTGKLATIKEPVSLPPEIEHVEPALTTVPLNVQVLSARENPDPETETVAPI